MREKILIGIAVAVLIFCALNRLTLKHRIRKRGIVVGAVVSRIATKEKIRKDGSKQVQHKYYAVYQPTGGNSTEARIGNATDDLTVGTRIRIRFLPGKPKYVLIVQ